MDNHDQMVLKEFLLFFFDKCTPSACVSASRATTTGCDGYFSSNVSFCLHWGLLSLKKQDKTGSREE